MTMWKKQILAKAIKRKLGVTTHFSDHWAQIWKEIAIHSLYFNAVLELRLLNYLWQGRSCLYAKYASAYQNFLPLILFFLIWRFIKQENSYRWSVKVILRNFVTDSSFITDAEECAWAFCIYLFHLLRLIAWLWSHSMLLQCLSSGLIPLSLFASQDVSCPTQLPYPICSEERTTTSYKEKRKWG